MSSSQKIGIGGAIALLAGLFVPIVSLPIVGSINLLSGQISWLAIIVAILAAGSAVFALRNQTSLLVWTGGAAAVLVVALLVRIQMGISEMRASLGEMEGNPFASIAEAAVNAVQIQWGWIILAGGCGALLLAGFKARSSTEDAVIDSSGIEPRIAMFGSGAAVLAGLFLMFSGWGGAPLGGPTKPSAKMPDFSMGDTSTSADDESKPSAETAAYMVKNLELYDLTSKYYDSMFEGRVPGVDFKIRNTGNRTLDLVTVRVEFLNGQGEAIAEEDFTPVAVSEFSYRNNTPLRPNYIWQQERNQFFSAKSVPDEWAEGQVRARIIDIEFSEDAANPDG